MKREVSLFERETEICYCVSGGTSSCQPCRDRRKAKAIPAGVYWSVEAGNFYSTATNLGMGIEFYEKWQDRNEEFPEKPTTSPGLDLELKKQVLVLQPDPQQQKMWEGMTRWPQASKDYRWWEDELKPLPSPRKMTATEMRERAQKFREFRQQFDASLPDLQRWQKEIEAVTGIGQIHDSIIIDTADKQSAKRAGAEREEGGRCIWHGCYGHYNVEFRGEGGCSCHISAPCGYCTSSYLCCNKCGDEEGEG